MCQRHQPASDTAYGTLTPVVHIAISSSHVALLQAANALGMALPAPKASAQEDEDPAGLTAASKADLHPQAVDAGIGNLEADINRYEQDGDTIANRMQWSLTRYQTQRACACACACEALNNTP